MAAKITNFTAKDVLKASKALIDKSRTHHQVDADLAVRDREEAYQLLEKFIEGLHPMTRMLY
jgi:hypothetical protein